MSTHAQNEGVVCESRASLATKMYKRDRLQARSNCPTKGTLFIITGAVSLAVMAHLLIAVVVFLAVSAATTTAAPSTSKEDIQRDIGMLTHRNRYCT